MMHPRVQKYLNDSGAKERFIKHLEKLADDPYSSRSGVDIRKLKGKKHDMYRLRVGDDRFEYFVDEGKVWIDDAFKRGEGYE
ncbi:MAG: type II toxin-antitoxin system RelE/ParE family toxin [Methanosarcinales archaeon]|uniref:Type II toxin-antitoxin system RelE/ParE family toxin n=1 Tax=Candidatus Ethanoperedens thermophilum TaxID=2766897 RepID=A0A848DA04_9EURY|nr:type II toxin-antitoxin system RelE/ParE family toxin [Candidatus Ethanoperedens thermophilum]